MKKTIAGVVLGLVTWIVVAGWTAGAGGRLRQLQAPGAPA